MPFLITVYISLYALILIFNVMFHIKHKAKFLILLYEIFSTLFLLYIIIAYWTPSLLSKLDYTSACAIIAIVIVDFYYSIWGKIEDIGFKKVPEIEIKSHDINNAKALSLIFAAPAYIISFLVLCNIFHFQIVI